MNHRILVVGKPSLSHARAGIDDYLRRLQRHGNYSLETLKDGPADTVSKRLLDTSQKSFRIILDERGRSPNTKELADRIADWTHRPDIKTLSYLIGPADGHTLQTRDAADYVLALSPLTLQHEIATVVLLEQLYRIATIHAGIPYHRT
ncbi:MAG: 23S rRNA (pseudouridine(1915)-N(3))-methyltransferase RlmH [Verrucomicrobiota bacterium]